MSDASTMDVINNFLATKGIYSLVLILLFLGLYGMIVSNNYMKKDDGHERDAGCRYLLLFVFCAEGRRYDSNFKRTDHRPQCLYQPIASCSDADSHRS